MEEKSPQCFALLLFLLLLLASEAPSRAEATRCRAKSRRFQGVCSNDRTCSIVCEEEGFELGRCSHLRRLCLCEKDCSGEIPGPPYPMSKS